MTDESVPGTPRPDDPRPDTKDWTWVLEQPCTDCGFVAADLTVADVAAEVRRTTEAWTTALAAPSASARPSAGVWSTTEYAGHVRDVHRVFADRLRLMLAEHAPVFADWNQDETALESRYDLAEPGTVAAELRAAAAHVAEVYDAVAPHQVQRPGLRSNGSAFTVETLARYHLHDVVHHLWDVRRDVTVAAYQHAAAAYRTASPALSAALRHDVESLAAELGAGAHVLEVGSGGGRDALALEGAGLRVRRTDVTPAFVDLLRAEGHTADVLDPLVDDLAPPDGTCYDGVWANACLLHVARGDLPTVLARLAAVTRPGGVLRASFKAGDGEGWSTHGTVTAPRMFVYWREAPLTAVVEGAGWRVRVVGHREGQRGESWLEVLARRAAGEGASA